MGQCVYFLNSETEHVSHSCHRFFPYPLTKSSLSVLCSSPFRCKQQSQQINPLPMENPLYARHGSDVQDTVWTARQQSSVRFSGESDYTTKQKDWQVRGDRCVGDGKAGPGLVCNREMGWVTSSAEMWSRKGASHAAEGEGYPLTKVCFVYLRKWVDRGEHESSEGSFFFFF